MVGAITWARRACTGIRNRGVVDPDGRVHGLENLYVAGSSVFPAVGAANPTLTLVAQVPRLADHLLEQFR